MVAFDATIAGFKIDDNAIYSIGKESATSGVRGIYLGKDGQMAVGDSNHYIKYYKDTDGSFKLAISAESMEFSSGTSVKDAIDNINNKVDDIKSIKNTTVTYQVGDSNTKAPTGTWSPNIPSVPVGKYLWTRTVFTYSDDTISTSYGISSMGAKGDQGIPGTNGQNGKSIGSVINYYLATNANTGVTASTSGWTTTVQSVSASKKYLWNYEIVKYTDGTIASTTAPCVIGSYGDTGEAGKNFNWNLIKYDYIEAMAAEIDKSEYVKSGKVICEGNNINSGFKIDSADCYEPSTQYILSGYITVISKTCNNLYFYNGKNHVFISLSIDGRNYSTPFNELIAANSILNDGKSHYFELRFQTATDIPGDSSVLYTYIQLNKSNATNIRYQITGLKLEKGTEATDWCPAQEDLKGEKGDTGATGKGVKSTAITYQTAANGTTVPTGTWVASPPTTTSALPYMWTRTIITYTDNTTSTSYSIGSTPEGIQVGGRNLLTGSAGWTKANPAKSTNAPDGYVYIGGRAYLENGKTYTLQAVSDSVWATGRGGQTGKATIWIHGLGDGFHRVFCGDGKTSGRYTWTFVHTSATQNCEIRINGYSKITSFWDIKIESGNKATDWTPAPEDVDSTINDVKESTNATLKLCVKEDETGRLKSMIEAIADTINITAKGGLNLTGNRFSVSSTNLTITKDGSMTCKNLSVTGGNINIEADDYQTGKISTHANWYTSSLSPFGLTATGRFNNATYSNSGIEFARNGTSESVIVIGCNSEVDDIGIYANSARITSQLTIPVGYNKLNQRATTSANSIQAFNYAWTINGTGLFILNAGVWTDTTDDYGTTNCAIYVNGACVVANTHRYGESSNSVELDAGATFVYWFVNANNQKVLLLAGSTKTGNKTLTYTVQGLFGLAVT